MSPPRLPWLAAAFGAGIWLAGAGGALASPAPWGAALLLLVCAARPRRARAEVVWLLAAAVLAGGARAAIHGAAEPPRLGPGVVLDDRGEETVTGVVRRVEPLSDGAVRVAIALEAPARGAVVATAGAGDAPRLWPGDRVAATGRLRTPRGYRNPGAADARRLARSRGGDLVMSASSIARLARAPEPQPRRWAARAQRHVSQVIAARGGDADGNAVVRAMVTGDRSAVAPELTGAFRDAGVSHVLAVSGLHLAAVALLAFVAARKLWASVPALALRLAPARAAAIVAAPAAVAYAFATGARPSTLRALVVVLVVIAGHVLGRRARIVDALGAAAVILLAVDPASLWDPGLQLSFAAAGTLAVAFTGPRGAARGVAGRAWRWGRDLFAASLWAAAATAPIAAATFGEVSIVGPLVNLVAVPLAELVVLPIGLAGTALSALAPALGGVLLDVAVAAAAVLAGAAELAASWVPGVRVPPPNTAELVACAVLLAAALAWRRRVVARRAAACAMLAAATFVAASYAYAAHVAPRWRGDVRVTFLDVGQGDAAVVELPGGATWLVDAGGLPFVPDADRLDAAERRRRAALPVERAAVPSPVSFRLPTLPGDRAVVPFLAARRIHRIDVMVVTHPHPDHYAGLAAIAGAVEIGEVWIARPHASRPLPPELVALLTELEARGSRVVHPRTGVYHGVGGGAVIEVLAPRFLGRAAAADPVLSDNDNSLVVRLTFAGRAILFAGDLEREGEALLARARPRAVRADVVKVAHHGSATSSTQAFVDAVRARWAVVSCGVANRFEFPDPAVVARWRAAGATLVRTDRRGAITVRVTPGGRIHVHTFD